MASKRFHGAYQELFCQPTFGSAADRHVQLEGSSFDDGQAH